MTEQCKNCGNSAYFPGGYNCFDIKAHVDDVSTCGKWIPRMKMNKEEIEHIRKVSDLSLATRNL